MKKNFLFILSVLAVSFSANAQSALPIDEETKLITYKKVTEVVTTTKTELYNRAFAWANTYYKNPANVIREKNAEEGKLILKGRYKIYNEVDKKTKVASDAGDVQYTLTIECKEAKYRYVLNNIGWQQTSAYPAEKWMDTKNQYYTKAWDYYLKQTDENVKKILSDLEKAMLTAPKVKKDEW